jgi:hypothetical protein
MYMMKAWASFAKQPESALSQSFGWPTYEPSGKFDNTQVGYSGIAATNFACTKMAGNTLVRLFYQNQTTASFVGSETYDGNCATLKCSDVLNITVPVLG